MKDISKKDIAELADKLEEIKISLNIPQKEEVLKDLSLESSKEDFWNNQQNAQDVLSQIADIQGDIDTLKELNDEVSTLNMLFDELTDDQLPSIFEDFQNISQRVSQFETRKFLSGKYDKSNAIFSIHAGQGGTEANDWAEMLFRMYTKYFDKMDWKYTVTEMTKGNETGISTVTLDVNGKYAYGLLKKEHGTHRLVRLSPFNAQNLRQTSFAGVEVMPVMEDLDKNIVIPESDIDFKAVRSGGPGGQNVNKTSSAVQITHIPTGISVHCSEGRSQLQNRERAMQLLRGKLWKIVEENRLQEISDIKGQYKIAGWGNQIRNYILHPYKLVKDLRTGVETSNPESVLDGNIEDFIEAQVRIQ